MIHTVGPVYSRRDDRSATLRSCYRSSLRVAGELRAAVVAFPLISSGIFGWPADDALVQALAGIGESGSAASTVRLVLFDARTYDLAAGLLAAR